VDVELTGLLGVRCSELQFQACSITFGHGPVDAPLEELGVAEASSTAAPSTPAVEHQLKRVEDRGLTRTI
jgi:hypothetical protein